MKIIKLFSSLEKNQLNSVSIGKIVFYKTQNWHKEILSELKYKNWVEMHIDKNKIRKEGFGFKQGHIHIKSDCLNFDFFNFGFYPLPMGFICSEKLKNAIEKEGFTGMEFEPLNPMFSFDLS